MSELVWKRSTRCEPVECVEVASYPNVVYVRNSREPDKVLTFTRDEWDAFIAGAVEGEFDHD